MDAIELRMGEMRRYIITMIDEHSDYVLALAVPSLNSDIVNHFFSRAARLFPVGISQIITDNGKEFLGSFDKTLQEAAIKHLWTYPYTPKMNAICERFNRALREQFIEFNEILLFEDLALFNLKLAEYLALYNSKRLHKALALTTPVEYILKENKIAICGGPIHSKRTGRPGWVDMWDGWFRLQDMVEAGDEVSLSGDLIKRQPRRGIHYAGFF